MLLNNMNTVFEKIVANILYRCRSATIVSALVRKAKFELATVWPLKQESVLDILKMKIGGINFGR